MNQICTSVNLKIIIGTQTAFYNKRTLIHLTGPDMWDLFLYIDCFSAKSWYFRLLHSKIFFFSILDFKWMFWITKVFVCSSCLNFWHYTHTSIFLNLFTNFNQTKHKTSQGEGKSKLLNWRINNMHTYKNYSATILKIHASLFWVDSICSNHYDSNQT